VRRGIVVLQGHFLRLFIGSEHKGMYSFGSTMECTKKELDRLGIAEQSCEYLLIAGM